MTPWLRGATGISGFICNSRQCHPNRCSAETDDQKGEMRVFFHTKIISKSGLWQGPRPCLASYRVTVGSYHGDFLMKLFVFVQHVPLECDTAAKRLLPFSERPRAASVPSPDPTRLCRAHLGHTETVLRTPGRKEAGDSLPARYLPGNF